MCDGARATATFQILTHVGFFFTASLTCAALGAAGVAADAGSAPTHVLREATNAATRRRTFPMITQLLGLIEDPANDIDGKIKDEGLMVEQLPCTSTLAWEDYSHHNNNLH